MTSSLNVFVRVDGICCLFRSTEPNRTGKRIQVNSTRNRRVELKQNTPGQLERTILKYKNYI